LIVFQVSSDIFCLLSTAVVRSSYALHMSARCGWAHHIAVMRVFAHVSSVWDVSVQWAGRTKVLIVPPSVCILCYASHEPLVCLCDMPHLYKLRCCFRLGSPSCGWDSCVVPMLVALIRVCQGGVGLVKSRYTRVTIYLSIYLLRGAVLNCMPPCYGNGLHQLSQLFLRCLLVKEQRGPLEPEWPHLLNILLMWHKGTDLLLCLQRLPNCVDGAQIDR
jgi:hypothetical protein